MREVRNMGFFFLNPSLSRQLLDLFKAIHNKDPKASLPLLSTSSSIIELEAVRPIMADGERLANLK